MSLIDKAEVLAAFGERLSVVPVPRGLSEAAIQHVLRDAPTVECAACEQRELARGVWECQWWEAPCLHEGGCSKFQRRQP